MVGLTELAVVIFGALGTFFAPCAYALLPGYVGYAVHRTEGGEAVSTLLARGITAGAGVLLTLGILVGSLLAIGQRVATTIGIVEPLVGVAIVIFGVLLLIDRAPSLHIALPARRQSLLGFGLFGAGYSLAAVGCTLPVFLGVVGVATAAPAGQAVTLLSLYVGIVVVLMVAATLVAGVGADVGIQRFAMHTGWLQRLAGLVLILAGFTQIVIAFSLSATA